MKVKQIHKNIGVSIEGVDLSKIDENTFQKIKDLWVQYLIIIFPKQNISDEDHIKFGKKFGELEVHPSLSHRSSKNPEIYRVSNVDENGKIIPNKETSWQYLKQSWLWHTDSSFRKIPSNGSILHGISTTNNGGNTLPPVTAPIGTLCLITFTTCLPALCISFGSLLKILPINPLSAPITVGFLNPPPTV